MNDWEQWSVHVLKELERLDHQQEEILKSLGDIKVEIATLKIKASFWGAFAGMIPAVLSVSYMLVSK